jgi:capsular exopolysaccharide synthesis family protein
VTALIISPGNNLQDEIDLLKDRARICLNGRVSRPHVLGITSCQRGEGVTTVAANLAVALAQEGNNRVLLVDGNLAHPSLHKVFGTKEVPGIISSLGERYRYGGHWPVFPVGNGLRILLSGGRIDRPERILRDPQFKGFIEYVKPKYQTIIIDCPPVMGDRGSLILPSLCDSIILVVEAGKAKVEVAQRAKALLEERGIDILGVVLNKRKQPIPGFIYRHI